ncbi:MAG TPA: response regulator [Rubrivivax sp.]|nr:response regulator [Rubrivivax sp.]
MFETWWWWLPVVAIVLWWLAGRPGWPRRRRVREAPPLQREADRMLAPAPEPVPVPLPLPQDPDAERAAAAAAETALQEAQESARRELAARQAAEREAAAQAAARAAAERAAAARAQAERRAAEAAAREEAQRLAARAQRRLAEEQAEAARDAAARGPAASEAPAASEEPPLVMVADDSKVVRVKTSRLLAAHGFRVALAEDGVQALALIEQERPRVLVTDVEMPQLDGLELTRRLRADARTAQLPVIMITSADDRLAATARDVGVTVLMGKPYGDQDFVAQVARLARATLDA